jgi:hypothetical protein
MFKSLGAESVHSYHNILLKIKNGTIDEDGEAIALVDLKRFTAHNTYNAPF